jgi:HSF-type DNA-binding
MLDCLNEVSYYQTCMQRMWNQDAGWLRESGLNIPPNNNDSNNANNNNANNSSSSSSGNIIIGAYGDGSNSTQLPQANMPPHQRHQHEHTLDTSQSSSDADMPGLAFGAEGHSAYMTDHGYAQTGDLSSNKRAVVDHRYVDHYQDPVAGETTYVADMDITVDPVTAALMSGRGGVKIPFPNRLHYMLDQMDHEGLSGVVSWQPHGRCFVVHQPNDFVSKVLPK